MIRDEDLKHAIDYSEGQKQAAYAVLGEIVNILNEFEEDIRIIGGWVPSLVFPEGEHIGSIDVDVLLNQEKIKKAESYLTIKRILLKNGYQKHPEKFFTFVKSVTVDGVSYDVDVDFLSGNPICFSVRICFCFLGLYQNICVFLPVRCSLFENNDINAFACRSCFYREFRFTISWRISVLTDKRLFNVLPHIFLWSIINKTLR